MKKQIRAEIIAKRSELSNEQVVEKSHVIIDKVVKYLNENNYKNILIYMDMKNEVMATKLLDYDFNIYITKSMPKSILYVTKYDKDELVLHPYGYYESSSEDYIDSSIIDAVIVPGVAFDLRGNRLGYGKGYYDRFLLKNSHVKRIAICFDLQLVDSLPTDEYDQKMDFVITETQILSFSR